VKRRLTPHPVSTFDSPMWIDNPVGNGRPLTYIHCTNPVYGPLEEAVGEEAGKLEMAGNIDRS
jgi:hypothetical protein